MMQYIPRCMPVSFSGGISSLSFVSISEPGRLPLLRSASSRHPGCVVKSGGMAHQPEPRHTAIPVSCPHCKQKQFVHVGPRAGIAQPGNQTINCVKCKGEISVTILDQIVGDPFKAA